jgi:hypothetical protein
VFFLSYTSSVLNSPKVTTGKPPINDYDALPTSLLKQTLGLQNRQHGHYLGQTSEYDVRLINLSPFNGRGEHISMPGTLRRVSLQSHFIMKSESQAEVDDELANLDLVESIVQPHGRALVDLYFRIIHPSFPIMHKKVFLEKYDRSYREFTPPVLAAVYILALNWWSYTPELVNLPKPDTRRLERLMPQMLSTVLNRPKLSTVQAGLLLLQCPEADSWALTGQLVAVAQNLGLHLDSSKWRIPEWERSLRKRLAWALYMQDKWGALVHGRPQLIHPDNWTVQPVEDRDFPETADDDDDEEGSSDVETGRLTFIHMISLTEILTEILGTFFTLKATASFREERGNAMIATLQLAKPIQIRLKEWHAKLPRSLAIGNTKSRKLSPTGMCPTSNQLSLLTLPLGSLQLAYFATEVTLHRAIIRFDSPNLSPDIRAITREAAKTRLICAIEMVNKLEPAHLQSFWYFASKANLAIIGTFGSLLWATSDNAEEAESYKEKLAEYRWTLRVSSKAAEFMKFTVGMLDSSPVFVKDGSGGSKTSTPLATKEIPTKDRVDTSRELSNSDMSLEPPARPLYESIEASPSIGASTENAYNPYDQDLESAISGRNSRPVWTNFSAHNTNFTSAVVQDWSLDPLYNFDNFQVAEDIFTSRRFIEEYDESGNNFAGF